MVSVEEIHLGNLLISKEQKIYCIIKIKNNKKRPHKSIIQGIDENDTIFKGTPDEWFYLWESSCLPEEENK